MQLTQRIRNWRRGFFSRALTVVKISYEEYLEAHPKASRQDIMGWVKECVHPKRGCAWWKIAPTAEVRQLHMRVVFLWLMFVRQHPKPQGALLSSYIIKVLSPHFKQCTQSHLEEGKPPIGAVSLACAAVSTHDAEFLSCADAVTTSIGGSSIPMLRNWQVRAPDETI